MNTVGAELTTIQSRLHDAAAIWSRAELLRLYNDAYKALLAQSGAFSRVLPLDMPGRFTYAVSYAYETRHLSGGTSWYPLLSCYGDARKVTAQWEAEHLGGVTPSVALVGLTQQWERAHTSDTDRHYSFGLPTDHERVRRLEWADRVLLPLSVREFDEIDDAWMRQTGDPRWWTTGIGQVRSVEVYEIATTYQQGYQLMDAHRGLPREITGDRTYDVETGAYRNAYAYASQGESDGLTNAATVLISGLGYRFTDEPDNKALGFAVFPWEREHLNGDTLTTQTTPAYVGMFWWDEAYTSTAIDFGLGLVRGIASDDRQYLPMLSDATPLGLAGTIRDWRSSVDNLMVLEQIVPTIDLTDGDVPALLPDPMQKYLRYYVWTHTFGREGEGQNVEMAQHYDQRFQRGVRVLKRLADTAQADRVYRRQAPGINRGRVPLVQLPSQFERVF